MKLVRKILFFAVVLFISASAYSVCDFTVSKTTVCAGDIINVKIDTPYAKYHNIIVYKGTFPFGAVAQSPRDFQYLSGSIQSDNEINITFSGATSAQTYQILLAESNNDFDPNPTTPCGKSVTITVNPSPNASFTETNNFIYCSATGNTTITMTNTSTTQANNTNYTIDWGDGQPQFSSASYSSTTHTYAPGSYKLTYTVTGNFAPCNKAIRTVEVVIGATAPRFQPGSAPTVLCAPAAYQLDIDTSVTNRNTPDTYYKFYVNGQLAAQYTQGTLPTKFTYFFTEGSCDANRSECSPDKDFFSVRSVAQNQCGVNPFTNCVAVQDSVAPKILGKDTACLNIPEQYINADPKGRVYVFSDGKCEKRQTWEITPNTGFTTTTPLYPTVTDQDLSITFTAKGTYQIKLTGLGYCDTLVNNKTVVVVDQVVANDTFPAPPCLPASGFVDIPFTNTSFDAADIISYLWNLPSANASIVVGTTTSKDVTIRFTKSGTYNVSMTAFGGCNQSTKNNVVVIKGKGNIDTGAIPPGCSVPYTFNPSTYFTFNDGGDTAATYTWSFPGATPNSSTQKDPGNITYAAAGPFNITLRISNICGDSSLTKPITVFNNPKPNAGPDLPVCKFSPPFALTALPADGIWRGSGITDSINGIFNSNTVPTGTYQIIYALNPNNCPTYDTIHIKIVEIIGLTAGPDQTICKSTGTLTLVSDPNFPNGNWFGPGVTNPTLGIFDPTGVVPGQYQVGYVYADSTGTCRDTAYKKVSVFDSVHLVVPAPELCAGVPFNFGTITGNISLAVWKFGDGTPDAIIPNPSHTYASPGNYIVTLIAETPDRCKDTVQIPITVIGNPPLSFIVNPDSSCTGNNISFTFPPGHDTATNYIWDFGTTTIQTATPTPQIFSFAKPVLKDTNYLVTLRADYFCGASFFTDTIKVKANPVADFGVQPVGCSPFTPTLANTSYGSPTTFSWNFGNGQTTTVANPAAPTYVNTTRRDSVYTITLQVSNACGADTVRKDITVKANDVFARFFTGINQGCEPIDVDFNSISSPGAQIIWDFGDGTTAYADNVVHTYDSAGVFRVKLLALGTCGRDSAFTTVTVFATPNVGFTYQNACEGQPTQFINTTTNGNSNTWYFGDGTQSTTPNPSHVYAAAGSYKVKLIVANSRPCVDSFETTIVVSVPPTADFSVTNPEVCEEVPTVFLNNSSNANSYLWYFGNGETSTQPVPAYSYPNSGTFTPSLVAINGQCRDSAFLPAAVRINPKPIADFLYDLGPNGFHDPIEFTNITLNGISFFWTFGDGDTSVERDPIHQYDGQGPYRVTLYTVSSFGCKDTATKPLGVDYEGQLYVPNVFSPEVGLGETAIFKPKGLSLKEYHLQIFSTYGQLLWETTQLENGQPVEGWDGRYKGTILPQDVYVWKIRAIFTNGKAWEGMKDPKTGKKAVMGSVVLLR